jgi:hypothetical protein
LWNEAHFLGCWWIGALQCYPRTAWLAQVDAHDDLRARSLLARCVRISDDRELERKIDAAKEFAQRRSQELGLLGGAAHFDAHRS